LNAENALFANSASHLIPASRSDIESRCGGQRPFALSSGSDGTFKTFKSSKTSKNHPSAPVA
jgi:hypothetical protein